MNYSFSLLFSQSFPSSRLVDNFFWAYLSYSGEHDHRSHRDVEGLKIDKGKIENLVNKRCTRYCYKAQFSMIKSLFRWLDCFFGARWKHIYNEHIYPRSPFNVRFERGLYCLKLFDLLSLKISPPRRPLSGFYMATIFFANLVFFTIVLLGHLNFSCFFMLIQSYLPERHLFYNFSDYH